MKESYRPEQKEETKEGMAASSMVGLVVLDFKATDEGGRFSTKAKALRERHGIDDCSSPTSRISEG